MHDMRVVIGLLREWRDADFALSNHTFGSADALDTARLRLKKATNALREWTTSL